MTADPSEAQRRRPRSLAEVASWGMSLGHVDAFLREFLDEFYAQTEAARRQSMLLEEPELMADPRANAYLAAVAEHLAFAERHAVPAWATEAPRFLKRPYFPAGLESLKATLLMESPTAFRRRLIFVGANPLQRPHGRRTAA